MLSNTYSQPSYQVVTDSATGEKIYLGSIRKSDIATPAFPWYAESQRIYPEVNQEAVEALKTHKDKIYLIIFAGTWCEDSHFVIPKFFKIQEAAGFPEDRMAIFAVDQNKEMPNHLPQAMTVHNAPTIIVMENGREKGRLIEYGKTGMWDKELADIINSQ